MTDALAPAARAAGRRPAGPRRPDPGLRLRLRAARRRPDRPRGGGGVRRRPTASTRPRSRACWRWRTTSSASPAACSTRPTGGRHGHLGRHRVGACSRCRRPATPRPTSTGPSMVLPRPRTRRSTRPRTTSASRRCWCRSAPTSAPTSRRRRRRSTSRRPDVLVVGVRAVVRARRRRPDRRARGRAPPRAASAATSTPASAAGCCRTPPGSAATCRRGRSRSRASPRSRSTCTSTPTPPRAPRCCCTARPELRRPQFFASADWPGYTMLNSTMQSTKSGGPLAGAWAVVESLGDEGYLRSPRQAFEAVDADRRRRRRRSGAALRRRTRTRRWSRWRPTARCDASRSATRWPRAAGTSSRRCRTPARRRPSTCR